MVANSDKFQSIADHKQAEAIMGKNTLSAHQIRVEYKFTLSCMAIHLSLSLSPYCCLFLQGKCGEAHVNSQILPVFHQNDTGAYPD